MVIFRFSLKVAVFIYGIAVALLIYIVEAPGYRIELEGLTSDPNFRDVGTSINECLVDAGIDTKSISLKAGLLMRANSRFSGFSCSKVGRPDAILTLNQDPKKNRKYFCLADDREPLVGFIPPSQTAKLADLEFIETWDVPEQSVPTCEALQMAVQALSMDRSLLVHCQAGRDRTGAFSAILTALALEGLVEVEKLTQILECDYRKSKSLVAEKYGRVEKLVVDVLSKNGSFVQFIREKCPQVNPEYLIDIRLKLLAHP